MLGLFRLRLQADLPLVRVLGQVGSNNDGKVVHTLVALAPASWTHFTVLFVELHPYES